MNVAEASSYTVTCDPPTERTDGTPLALSEIAEYNWLVDGSLDGTSTACLYTVTRPDGIYTVTATTMDTGGLTGPESPGKLIELVTAPPMPPVLQ